MMRSLSRRWAWTARSAGAVSWLGLPAAYVALLVDPAVRAGLMWGSVLGEPEGAPSFEAARGTRLPIFEGVALAGGHAAADAASARVASPATDRVGVVPSGGRLITAAADFRARADVLHGAPAGGPKPVATRMNTSWPFSHGIDSPTVPPGVAVRARVEHRTVETPGRPDPGHSTVEAEMAERPAAAAGERTELVRSPQRLAAVLQANLVSSPPLPLPTAAARPQPPLQPAQLVLRPEPGSEPAAAAVVDVDGILDELYRRLELQFLRMYGTSGG